MLIICLCVHVLWFDVLQHFLLMKDEIRSLIGSFPGDLSVDFFSVDTETQIVV